MDNNLSLSAERSVARLFTSNRMGQLKGLLAVLVPFVILAEFAGTLGTDTSFATAVVINLAYLLAVILATVVLKGQGLGWRSLGLARPESWKKTILIALGALLVMIVALLATQVLLMNFPGLALEPSDQSDYSPLTGNLPLFLIMAVGSFTLVAFGEEMVFRAFLINSLAGVSGSLKGRWTFALVGSSLLFALGHYD